MIDATAAPNGAEEDIMRYIISLVAFVVCAASTSLAQAKDMSGKWGFGGSVQAEQTPIPNAPTANIEGVFWLGQLGLEGRLAFALQSVDGGNTSVGSGGGIGLIYNFAQFDDVNIGTGLRFGGRFFYGGGPADNALYKLAFSVPLRGEYFLSEHFAINASVGIGVDVGIDPGFVSFGTASTGLFGNAGFIWYLE